MNDADKIIEQLESMGLGWSLDHTGRLIEARVWKWPSVIGRYRPNEVEPLADMLLKAMDDAGIKSDLIANASDVVPLPQCATQDRNGKHCQEKATRDAIAITTGRHIRVCEKCFKSWSDQGIIKAHNDLNQVEQNNKEIKA